MTSIDRSLDPKGYEEVLLAEMKTRGTAGLPKWTLVDVCWEGDYPNSVLRVTYKDHRRELTQVDEWPFWGTAATLFAGPDGLPDSPDCVATLIFTMIDEAVEVGGGPGEL